MNGTIARDLKLAALFLLIAAIGVYESRRIAPLPAAWPLWSWDLENPLSYWRLSEDFARSVGRSGTWLTWLGLAVGCGLATLRLGLRATAETIRILLARWWHWRAAQPSITELWKRRPKAAAAELPAPAYAQGSATKPFSIVGHWHHHAEDFNTSALEFYDSVRDALQAMQAPVKFFHVDWNEGGIHSAKRVYLRIEHNRLLFDICAAPFGNAFFFSWWLTERSPALGPILSLTVATVGFFAIKLSVQAEGFFGGLILAVALLGAIGWVLWEIAGGNGSKLEDAVLAIPGVRYLYSKFFRPATYFATDSRIMFEETVHETVVQLVNGLLIAKGLAELNPEQRRPDLKGAILK